MTATDPLATVWAALDQGGYGPHGKPYDFRSRCPGHDGDNDSALHVREGVDRRVLLRCFAHHCPVDQITARLGLTVSDLFPAGHHTARRRRLPEVRRTDLTGNAQTIAAMLAALNALAIPWTAMVGLDCPYCGSQGAWLRATAIGTCPLVDCPEGCTVDEITGALAGRLHNMEDAA